MSDLKVSCKSLSISFAEELNKLANIANYIHVSDNDGVKDSNGSLKKDSDMFDNLVKIDWSDKIVTLEVYEKLNEISKSYNLVNTLFGNN